MHHRISLWGPRGDNSCTTTLHEYPVLHGRRDPILVLKKKNNSFFLQKKNTEWWVKLLLTSFFATMNHVALGDMCSCTKHKNRKRKTKQSFIWKWKKTPNVGSSDFYAILCPGGVCIQYTHITYIYIYDICI